MLEVSGGTKPDFLKQLCSRPSSVSEDSSTSLKRLDQIELMGFDLVLGSYLSVTLSDMDSYIFMKDS
jgi:hypothetical protein